MLLNLRQLKELKASSPHPNRVKKAIELVGMTQVQVAEALGITQPHVTEVANGNYTRLPLETARRFADLFGCAIEDLFPLREEAAATRR